MATTILVIFLLIFTIIKASERVVYPCVVDPKCHCLTSDLSQVRIYYNISENWNIAVKARSWSDLQIDCQEMGGLDKLNYFSNQSEKMLNSLEFINCKLPKASSLRDVSKIFGVEGTKRLYFRSFKYLGDRLKKGHLEGFSNVTKLVLAHNSFNHLPKDIFLNFLKLEHLDLSDNELDTLSKGTFRAIPNLKHLQLNHNFLEEFVPKIFHELPKLEYLDLKENLLEKLNDDLFDNLTKLRYLNLKTNALSELPPMIFHKLKLLGRIDLSFNKFRVLPIELFSRNKRLRQVILHNNKVPLSTLPDNLLSELPHLVKVSLIKNGIKELSDRIFRSSTSLAYIYLDDNSLRSLPLFIFFNLKNLKILSIKNNRISRLPDEIFYDLENLRILDLSMNRLPVLLRKHFEHLRSLKKLYLNNNRLKYFEPGTFYNLNNLTVARLSMNKLTLTNSIFENDSPFMYNSILKELDLSKNRIVNFIFDWLVHNNNLTILDLTDNNIKELKDSNFVHMPDNILVDLRFNKIERIWLNDIEDLSVHFNKRRYVDIRIEKNPLICNCYLYDLLRYLKDDLSFNVYNFVDINLKYVKCKYPDETDWTEIKELDFRTYVCPEEEYFNIKKCPISCNCNIRLYDGTRILDCSDRLKSEFKIQKTEINYAGKNPLIANFTYNFLTEIPSLEALQTINVTDLLLSHNWITHVNVERIPATVTILHLDNNYIYTVDGNLINFLTLNPLKEFTLHGNLMECDCSLAPFLTFVKLQRHYYKDLNNVKCKGSHLHVYKLSLEYICPLNLDYY